MKPSKLLLCLAPTVVLAVESEKAPAVAPSPSLPNNTPPVPLPAVPIRPQDESPRIPSEAQMIHLPVVDGVTLKPETIPIPLLSRTKLSLRSLRSSTGLTKSLRARSEGTLGQTPWIGMAIGLTCTTLAAVMLG
ncbi:hypothetical protein ARAM_004803 [Aspergillus rambellii]|uniref:Uncharacterized protein n=2 Tax=Aspergillus subgen. Nidulantes TaxID=2720870 RepID=A0A0F8WUI6_9EURO|nr:hypothetical protein ARAM_004803 [Aspergillus rambellii]